MWWMTWSCYFSVLTRTCRSASESAYGSFRTTHVKHKYDSFTDTMIYLYHLGHKYTNSRCINASYIKYDLLGIHQRLQTLWDQLIERLKALWSNVVSNAIHFSPAVNGVLPYFRMFSRLNLWILNWIEIRTDLDWSGHLLMSLTHRSCSTEGAVRQCTTFHKLKKICPAHLQKANVFFIQLSFLNE